MREYPCLLTVECKARNIGTKHSTSRLLEKVVLGQVAPQEGKGVRDDNSFLKARCSLIRVWSQNGAPRRVEMHHITYDLATHKTTNILHSQTSARN